MEIIVAETGSARFAAWLNGELLCQSRTPLLSAARELLGRGVPASTELAMRHAGSSIVAMRTTVGAAARLTVEEGEGAPRFRPYKAPTFRDGSANSADRGSEASGIGPEQTAVCGLARATENA
jgi:hypothetical protein